MKRMITAATLLLGATTSALAASFTPPPPLDPALRPVLLYSESEYGKEPVNLYATYKKDNTWQRDLIASAAFLAVEPLVGARFFIATGPSAQESELFLVDLENGTSVQLTTRKGHCPIAFLRPHERYFNWKEAQKAYLLQDGDGATDLEYIEVNYADMTFETQRIPKSDFGGTFNDQTHTKIAPNGEHIAFLAAAGAGFSTPRTQEYEIKVWHRQEKHVTTVAQNVAVQVAENAPTPFGWPAFEWYDWEVIVYTQTDAVSKGNTANVNFMTTHIHKQEIATLLSQELPLTAEGGELYRENPLVKVLVYRTGGLNSEEFAVDRDAQVLMAWRDPDAIRFEAKAGDVQVSTATRLLLHAKQHFAGKLYGLVAPMKKNFAYSLSTPQDVQDKERKAELYVNLGEADAEKVIGPVYYCKPLGWIE